jgi:serine/threonine-protein kinase RsbW
LRDDGLISLRMEGLRKCVRMRLRDYGEKVFPLEMKGRSHDLIKPGGLGLHLIRYAFDQVDYIHKPRGTELVLTKNLA